MVHVVSLNVACIFFHAPVHVFPDDEARDVSSADENNMLRLWSIHDYAPELDLYVSNYKYSTQIFQRSLVFQSYCRKYLKQVTPLIAPKKAVLP